MKAYLDSEAINLEDNSNIATDGSDHFQAYLQRTFLQAFWYGGSTFDAWFNICSSKIAQVLLTLPFTFAQMGLSSGITFELLQGIMGSWSSCMFNCVYLEYRRLEEKRNPEKFNNHSVQVFEVLGGVLGPWWRAVGLFFNVGVLFCSAAIQIIASANIVYYISDSLPKRTWTFIFGSCFFISVLIPSAHNYRTWSFLGVIMLTYTGWYMTIASMVHGKTSGVQHTAPRTSVAYFSGAANLIAFGGHSVPVEIMDAMWKPNKFKIAYLYAILYTFSISIPSSVSVYWVFGDALLKNSNAFALLPRNNFRDTAVVLMLFHQFGILSLPLYMMWEKLLRIHNTGSYTKKTMARVPIFLTLWFTAIAFPFFGAINSVVASLFLSWGNYIIPCAAYVATYRTSNSRLNAVGGSRLLGMKWRTMMCLNAVVILWILIMGTGFGAWTSITNLVKQADQFGMFAKCYQCAKS